MRAIRKAVPGDLPAIYSIYESARSYMRTHGNPDQWENDYPPEDLIKEDLRNKRLYVITEDISTEESTTQEGTTQENTTEESTTEKVETVEAVFVFFTGEEEAYNSIEGSWTYNLPYGVIHRVASSGKIRGVTKTIFDYAFTQADYLRIDTHEDNQTMQTALLRYGFRRCGTIFYSRNNSLTKRIAYDLRCKSI